MGQKKQLNNKLRESLLGDPETYDKMFKVIAVGESANMLCKAWDIPYGSLMSRINADPDLRYRYEVACQARAYYHMERVEEIANDVEHSMEPQRAKVVLDARRWLASKMDPTRFGDRQRIDLTTTDLTKLHLDAIKELGMSEDVIVADQ